MQTLAFTIKKKKDLNSGQHLQMSCLKEALDTRAVKTSIVTLWNIFPSLTGLVCFFVVLLPLDHSLVPRLLSVPRI